MVVSRERLLDVLHELQGFRTLSLDTETTGLRPFHGDTLFSIAISTEKAQFYFNFNHSPGIYREMVLLREDLQAFRNLFSNKTITWYLHNAKFDLAFLHQENLEILGKIHCTQAMERVVFNDYPPGSYDLDSCARRLGFEKDDAVEKYITSHKLWTYTGEEKPGTKQKLKHYENIPFEIIHPYAEKDAEITFKLGEYQTETIKKISALSKEKSFPIEADQEESYQNWNAKNKNKSSIATSMPTLRDVQSFEQRLTPTIFRMESVGVRIDPGYTLRAASHAHDGASFALAEYRNLTGKTLVTSSKHFQETLIEDKEKWVKTEKGNYSFEADILKTFTSRAAHCVLDYRDSISRKNFYHGFLWHADSLGTIHPTFNPAGTATGRFSSSHPNLQNLTAEEGDEEKEFIVRRSFVPRPGFIFVMLDYDQMEYRLMFDEACKRWGNETDLVRKIKEGADPHQATADIITSMGKMTLTRKKAKNGNFAILYGAGIKTLAKTIQASEEEAHSLKTAIWRAAPEVKNLIIELSDEAITEGYITNWAGRRSYLVNRDHVFKMPNYLIQGGCADVNKIALNRMDEYLLDKKSRLLLTIHDEAVLEVHESEIASVPKACKEIMENVYPYKYLPLTCGVEWSAKSLGDKIKGFPI